ncbi:hypothetical protein T02_6733 [Trichinella nativa]|uniref:Uncharacterized protein n=1 Tax=Trichinella nativa TaxID=6335 RepID=A0A0V1LEJ4_9BILA|nr:hypothetical protein T06_10392 [Trichinella sp. T6]KRZ57944.1 hypothetical protein T02_6733 [Trichinella nativa]
MLEMLFTCILVLKSGKYSAKGRCQIRRVVPFVEPQAQPASLLAFLNGEETRNEQTNKQSVNEACFE